MLTALDTAYSIAVVRAREGELPATERLFEDPYAGIFAAAGAHASEGTTRFLELPFFAEGVRLRTRFVDDFVRGGLRSGVIQVVLLGAGFDARGLRMPEMAAHGASVYEVEFDQQLETKRKLLEAARVALPDRIRYVACDFNAPDFEIGLTARLVECGFRLGAGALFVWEGVIAYIGAEAVDRTLRFVVRAGGPGCRLVFDFAPTAFENDPAATRIERAGFTRFEQVGYDEIWRLHLPGEPHPNASVACMGTAFV
jgi:methyltransferase (TIGR00027 family)